VKLPEVSDIEAVQGISDTLESFGTKSRDLGDATAMRKAG
jgi:FPC/CPF motif-containing protein YcgG